MIRNIIFPIVFLAFSTVGGSSAPVELSFPQSLSWKAVFDGGFRPKYIPGLERKKVECVEQEVVFRYHNKPEFHLDRGRLMFELQSDDSIRVIEHVGRVPVSMEEGAKRMDRFHALFDRELLRRGAVPPQMEEEFGSVKALSDYYAAAENEGYTIHFGFTSSFQREKPLIPIFMIALRHRMDIVPLPVRRSAIEPPKGYEWYSLDPKVNTPDSASKTENLDGPEIKNSQPQSPDLPGAGGKSESSENPQSVMDGSRLGRWLGVFGALLITTGVVIRMLAKKKS
jgi:hypothetical protein